MEVRPNVAVHLKMRYNICGKTQLVSYATGQLLPQ
jgi:hypothetical protein